MKKIISMLFVALLLVACSDTTGPYKNGTYQGKANGYGGELEVTVVIEKGNIKEITIGDHSETPGISDGAFDNILPAIIDKQSTEGVDVFASATVTSNAVLQAVEEALSKAE